MLQVKRWFLSTAIFGQLSHRFSLVHENHKQIAAGALAVGLFVLAAKLFVAAREVAIAWRYGVSGVVDAYQLTLTVTTWLPTVLVGVATSVLVPRLVGLTRDREAYRRLIAELNGSVLLIGAGTTVATWMSASFLANLLGEGLDSSTRDLTELMSTLLAPLALLAIIAGYFSIRLQARQRYGYSLAEAIPAFVITIAIIVAPDAAEVAPLVWGTLAGYVLQALWLLWMTRRSDPPVGAIRVRHQSPAWTVIYGSLLIMLAGQVLLAISQPIDQAFAAFVGEGGVAVLSYASRIITLIVGFGSVIVARALLPVLSGVAADGDLRLGRSQTLRWCAVLFMFGIIVGVAAALLASWVVPLLFERGAFTRADSLVVAEVFRYGLIQLPFFFGGLALVQWVAASGRYVVLLYAAAIGIAVKIAMNFALVGPLGLVGIMTATAGMYASTMILQLVYVMRDND